MKGEEIVIEPNVKETEKEGGGERREEDCIDGGCFNFPVYCVEMVQQLVRLCCCVGLHTLWFPKLDRFTTVFLATTCVSCG